MTLRYVRLTKKYTNNCTFWLVDHWFLLWCNYDVIIFPVNWLCVSVRRQSTMNMNQTTPLQPLPSSQPHTSPNPPSHQPTTSIPHHDKESPHCHDDSDDDNKVTTEDASPDTNSGLLGYRAEVNMKPYNQQQGRGRVSRDLTPQFVAAETLSSTPTKVSIAFAGIGVQQRCTAITHTGAQCRLRSQPGSRTCHRHDAVAVWNQDLTRMHMWHGREGICEWYESTVIVLDLE